MEIEKQEGSQLEILQMANGTNIISAAIMESDGSYESLKKILETDFDRLKESSKNSSFLKNLFFAIKMTDEITPQLTILAGKLLSFTDSIVGSHIVFMDTYAVFDGVALMTMIENELIVGVEQLLDFSKEDTMEIFNAIYSLENKDEASLKIIFGTKNEETEKIENDSVAIISGRFHQDTWDLLRSFMRVSTVPAFFKRIESSRTIGFATSMDNGLNLLDAVLQNIDNFSDNIKEDLSRFIK